MDIEGYMHVIACPNHPPVISWPHEFQHLLLFVLGWRKVNWELHVGWRLSGYCVPVKCCMFFVSRITGCHEAHFQGFLDF